VVDIKNNGTTDVVDIKNNGTTDVVDIKKTMAPPMWLI
jgi:hypothetical protein